MEDLKFLIYFCVCVGSVGCQYTTNPCRRRPGVTLDATSTEQFITSPGFPINFANDLNCNWKIRNTADCGLIRIDVKFIEFESEHDTLQFQYGSSIVTKENIMTTSEHMIPSESVTIRFTSDYSNTGPGFKLSYSIAGIDVKATYTRKYITSPGFPYANQHNTMCRWNIATSTACTLLRLDTIDVDPFVTLTIRYDGGLRKLLSNKTYTISSNRSVLVYETDRSVIKRGFNISYEAKDLQIAKTSSVFGCKDFQLLAETKPKYVFSSNYPENIMDTDCNWMIFSTEPCTTTSTVNGSKISVVVEEFKSNGSSPITIFKAASRGNITINMSQESSLVGKALDFYVLKEEFVLITARHIGEMSVFKLSFQIDEKERHNKKTVWIASASMIVIACIVTAIVHIVVCLFCRKRPSQTKSRHSDNGNQQEANSTDEIYEDISTVDDPGTKKQDNYIIPGAGNEQGTEMYFNTDTTKGVLKPMVCIHDDGDEEVYEVVEDYINVSAKKASGV